MDATPRLKSTLLIGGFFAAVVAVYLFMSWRSAKGPAVESDAVLQAVPSVDDSVPGGIIPPDYQRVQEEAERQRLKEARQTGGSVLAELGELQPAEPVQPEEADTTPKAPPEQAKGRANADGQHAEDPLVNVKSVAIDKLLVTMLPTVHSVTNYKVDATRAETKAAEATTTDEAKTATIPAGEILFGISTTFVNSDEPSPVRAKIAAGKWKDAVLLGGQTRAGERLILEYNLFTYNGVTSPINAFAINPETARTALASDVNRRTFSRWAAVLSSAMLAGAQTALLSNGTSTVSGFGTVTQDRDFSPAEIASIAVGEIGNRTAPMAEAYFNRPPTVTLAAGEGIGILFAEAAEIKLTSGTTVAEKESDDDEDKSSGLSIRFGGTDVTTTAQSVVAPTPAPSPAAGSGVDASAPYTGPAFHSGAAPGGPPLIAPSVPGSP